MLPADKNHISTLGGPENPRKYDHGPRGWVYGFPRCLLGGEVTHSSGEQSRYLPSWMLSVKHLTGDTIDWKSTGRRPNLFGWGGAGSSSTPQANPEEGPGRGLSTFPLPASHTVGQNEKEPPSSMTTGPSQHRLSVLLWLRPWLAV